LLGDPEGGTGVTLASQSSELESHLILARKIRGLESHLSSASHFGKLFEQAIPAPQLCGVLLQANLADLSVAFKDENKAKKRRVNCVSFRGPVISDTRMLLAAMAR
jgi:hypothetical protein